MFLLDASLTIGQVFIVNAIFTGAMALFEVPTGVLAGTRGRRTSFLLSVLVPFIGTVGYMAASFADPAATLALLVVFSVLLGLGYTFYSGAVETWLVDALDPTGFDDEPNHVFVRGSMVSGAGITCWASLGVLVTVLSAWCRWPDIVDIRTHLHYTVQAQPWTTPSRGSN